jgi:hypothetical protein
MLARLLVRLLDLTKRHFPNFPLEGPHELNLAETSTETQNLSPTASPPVDLGEEGDELASGHVCRRATPAPRLPGGPLFCTLSLSLLPLYPSISRFPSLPLSSLCVLP